MENDCKEYDQTNDDDTRIIMMITEVRTAKLTERIASPEPLMLLQNLEVSGVKPGRIQSIINREAGRLHPRQDSLDILRSLRPASCPSSSGRSGWC